MLHRAWPGGQRLLAEQVPLAVQYHPPYGFGKHLHQVGHQELETPPAERWAEGGEAHLL